MTYDRDLMAYLWMCVSRILGQAEQLVGTDSHKAFFTFIVRKTARRLVRMAEFLIRRLIACDALALLTEGVVEPAKTRPETTNHVRAQGGTPADLLPRYNMRLVEPFLDLRPRKPAGPRDAFKHGRYDLMPSQDAERLRLRIEGLTAVIARRAERAQRLASWFASRGDQSCIPWRYGSTPFARHKEHGEAVRQAVQMSDDQLDALIEARASPG